MSNRTDSSLSLKIYLAIFFALNVALFATLVLALPELSKKVFGDCIIEHYKRNEKNLKITEKCTERTTKSVSCGKRSVAYGNVWGGKPSMVNAWPWLVAFKRKTNNKFFCTGSLISAKHVVSAANCFREKYMRSKQEPEDILALFGKHDLGIIYEEGSFARDVIEIILHKDWNYKNDNFDADISLIVLETAVDLRKPHYVGIVCLPPASDSEVTGNGTVVGWGISEWSEANGKRHDFTPNELKLPAVSQSQCFKSSIYFEFISSNRTFCAGFLNKEKSICKGDNGGGFYVLNRNSRAYNLVGIVSASLIDPDFNPCNTKTYTIFTDVTKYVDWIKTKMIESSATKLISPSKYTTTTRSTTTSEIITSTITTIIKKPVKCGKRSVFHGNVWGGQPSELNSWPWLVAFKRKTNNEFFCAGSLISAKHIVSAANCFQSKHESSKKEPEDISAMVGKHNFLVNEERGSVAHDVIDIILHEDWNYKNDDFDADISLIVLQIAVDLSKRRHVGIVCLPTASDHEVTENGTVVGWGISEKSDANREYHDSTPNSLQLPIVLQSQCFKANECFEFLSSDRTFCAGFLNQEKSVCPGDAGGGFYVLDRKSRAYNLVGIISSIIPDPNYNSCNTETYSIFTDVTKFIDWIARKIN